MHFGPFNTEPRVCAQHVCFYTIRTRVDSYLSTLLSYTQFHRTLQPRHYTGANSPIPRYVFFVKWEVLSRTYRIWIQGIIYPTVNGQSHRTIATTWPYNILRYWYGCYWTVVIAQLSAVDLPCKVNDKSRWPRNMHPNDVLVHFLW